MGQIVKTVEKAYIPITKTQFDSAEEQAVIDTLRSGWVVQGPRVAEFEKLFAGYTGSRYAIAASSCTTALHLTLVASGIGPGDSVIVPSLTYIATANAVEYAGAKPIFLDIDPVTFTLDVRKMESALKQNYSQAIKAIIPVSLFGLCADMPEINRIAKKYDLKVIEDAACGLGAYRGDRHAGTEASAAVFSLHPRKAISTGEGGMVTTDDDAIADAVRSLRNHGASTSDMERHINKGGSLLPEFNVLGYNYRLTDIQGAIGVAQMAKADWIFSERRKIASRYDRLLKDVPGINTPTVPNGCVHAYQSYVCYYKFNPAQNAGELDWGRIDEANRERNQVMAALENEGIAVRQGTHAVHTLGYYQKKYGLHDRDFPYAYMADRLSMALPLYPGMAVEDQDRVVATLKKLMNSRTR